MPPVSLSWDEGRYFDLWMPVHFLSGVAGGLSNAYFELTSGQVLGFAVLLMLLWELFEFAARIRESAFNRLIDIAIGLAGVMLALWITSRITPRGAGIAFAATLTVALMGMVLGSRAAKRRKQSAAGGG